MARCAVVGASGYAGAELVSILAAHPELALASVHADSHAGARFEELFPGLRHRFRGRLEGFDAAALHGMDVVFLALPHGSSAKAASMLAGKVGTIVDLSGDLRLPDAASYRRWYGSEHPAPELLGRAVYGLPELFGDDLPGATLVACAGCYATAVQLAAAPALAWGDGVEVVATALSGTTGAGRKADLALSFSEMAGNVRAYRIGTHQHAPEIALGLGRHAGRTVRVTFIPHVVPIARGILATVILRHAGAVDPATLLDVYRSAYDGRDLVRVGDPALRLPSVQDVVGTDFCDVAPSQDESGGSLVVVAALDNLRKGAAGQAVQIANLVCGFPETTGLLPAAPVMEVGLA